MCEPFEGWIMYRCTTWKTTSPSPWRVLLFNPPEGNYCLELINKTENPSKDALQKAETWVKKCKLRKMTRLTLVTRLTGQTRQIFQPDRPGGARTVKHAKLPLSISHIRSSLQEMLAHLKMGCPKRWGRRGVGSKLFEIFLWLPLQCHESSLR